MLSLQKPGVSLDFDSLDIENGIYTHSVIVHERHFVDPEDAEIHTQNIENMWMRSKRKSKRQFGASSALFPSYLSELAYRNSHRDLRFIFGSFLLRIGKSYTFVAPV